MNNTTSSCAWRIGGFEKSPHFPQCIPPSQEPKDHSLPSSPFRIFPNCSWGSSTPTPQLPFRRCCLLFLPQVLSFPQENICLPITLIMPLGSRGRPWRRISSGFCLLYWENKQACLTYLCFPSRWTPRSKHRVDLPPAPLALQSI